MQLKVTHMRPISIKNLRVSLAKVASLAEKGESFVVLRRSTPCFKIVPYTNTEEKKNDPYKNIPEIDLADEEGEWEQLIDFTEGGKKAGMPAKQFFDILEKVIKEKDGR